MMVIDKEMEDNNKGSSTAIHIIILFYGSTRDIAGVHEVKIDLPQGTTSSILKEKLEKQYGIRFERDRVSLALNKKYIIDEIVLHDGDTVALIPPISGG
eukprot:scaffold654_cov207-Ochromonas_danica.AAC.38